MKKAIALLLALCLMLTLVACSAQPTKTPADDVTIRLGGLKGPTTMGMVKLLDDNDKGLTENKYT